jgi:alanyl-tRNA synthetase
VEKLFGLRKLRLASGEEMMEILGREQGEVAPIGLPEAIPVVIDRRVLAQEFVIGSAGSKFAGLKINPSDILKCREAFVEEVGEMAGEDVEVKTHTALHVLKGAVQKVLGAKLTTGVYVNGNDGRLTVQFNRKPTVEEISRIENEANACVKRNQEVNVFEMDRKEAELKFGDIIYDAFPVPSHITRLKIAHIEGWNINCCNKTHTRTTGEVGKIKIDDFRFRPAKGILEISFKVG